MMTSVVVSPNRMITSMVSLNRTISSMVCPNRMITSMVSLNRMRTSTGLTCLHSIVLSYNHTQMKFTQVTFIQSQSVTEFNSSIVSN